MRMIGLIAISLGVFIAVSGEYVVGAVAILGGLSALIPKEKKPVDITWEIGSAQTRYVIQALDGGDWKDLVIEVEGLDLPTAYTVFKHAQARKERIETEIPEPLRIVKRTIVEEIEEAAEVA